MVMIELVHKTICEIQSGVSAHEVQVVRGYIINGMMIHDAQPSRARVLLLLMAGSCRVGTLEVYV